MEKKMEKQKNMINLIEKWYETKYNKEKEMEK